jgi:Fe-S-cluster containining protein
MVARATLLARSQRSGVQNRPYITDGSVRDNKRLPIFELFSRIDAETSAFALASGLRCPDGCGACCENPGVHTSVVELEPLARDLVARGQAEAALERAATTGPGRCVLYESHGPGTGRCTEYAFRPVVCRLFGFAAVRDKQARPELAGCKVHKTQQPEAMAHARALVAGGAPVPNMMAWQQEVLDLGTSATGTLVPINVAIQEALERALFAAALAGDDSGDSASLVAAGDVAPVAASPSLVPPDAAAPGAAPGDGTPPDGDVPFEPRPPARAA